MKTHQRMQRIAIDKCSATAPVSTLRSCRASCAFCLGDLDLKASTVLQAIRSMYSRKTEHKILPIDSFLNFSKQEENLPKKSSLFVRIQNDAQAANTAISAFTPGSLLNQEYGCICIPVNLTARWTTLFPPQGDCISWSTIWSTRSSTLSPPPASLTILSMSYKRFWALSAISSAKLWVARERGVLWHVCMIEKHCRICHKQSRHQTSVSYS